MFGVGGRWDAWKVSAESQAVRSQKWQLLEGKLPAHFLWDISVLKIRDCLPGVEIPSDEANSRFAHQHCHAEGHVL